MSNSIPSHNQLAAELLQALARTLAPLVAAELADQRQIQWIDQRASQLGRRRHIAEVRRLVALGDSGARILGRRHLLTVASHEAALARIGGARLRKVEDAATEQDEILDELGLRAVQGGRGR